MISNRHLMSSALGQITSEMLEQQRGRDRDQIPVEPTEMAQQVHVPLTGKAGPKVVITEQDVRWSYPFLMNVAQRQMDSTLTTPHFTPGFELRSAGHVILGAYIRSWTEDEAKLIIGARVRFSAWAPGAPKLVSYDAVAHLTFMGFAAPAEDDDTNDSGLTP